MIDASELRRESLLSPASPSDLKLPASLAGRRIGHEWQLEGAAPLWERSVEQVLALKGHPKAVLA
jgi:hypothetical protein